MTEADPLEADKKKSSPETSKENAESTKAPQKKASKRQLTPLGTRPAAEDNATGEDKEKEKTEEYTLQFRKPTRTAKKRPAYKLSVGLIDTYNCINEVSGVLSAVLPARICSLTLPDPSAALLREEKEQAVQQRLG